MGRLAYGINGDIYLADSDGRNRVRIANGASAATSARRRAVAHPWGPDTCGSYSGEGPIWSPDGRHLAYRGAVGRAGSCWGTVIISDPAGHRVASFPGEGWLISWSPDSTRVATWVSPRHTWDSTIGIYGLDGVRQALLTVPPGLMEPGDSDPVWSPDGTSLVVPQGVQIPLDGSAPLVLPANDPRAHYGAASSPDGSRIAWLHYGQPKGPVLVVAEPDGSQARVLTPGGVQGFKWSPTGDRIAFESQTRGARTVMGRPTELRIVNVATGTVTPLDGLGEASKLSVVKFSAEGDQILFSRTRANGGTSLWSVHADGSHPHLLVAGSDWGDWQSLSPTRSDPRLHGSATGRKK